MYSKFCSSYFTTAISAIVQTGIKKEGGLSLFFSYLGRQVKKNGLLVQCIETTGKQGVTPAFVLNSHVVARQTLQAEVNADVPLLTAGAKGGFFFFARL